MTNLKCTVSKLFDRCLEVDAVVADVLLSKGLGCEKGLINVVNEYLAVFNSMQFETEIMYLCFQAVDHMHIGKNRREWRLELTDALDKHSTWTKEWLRSISILSNLKLMELEEMFIILACDQCQRLSCWFAPKHDFNPCRCKKTLNWEWYRNRSRLEMLSNS